VNVGSGCADITRRSSCSLPSARVLFAEDAYPLTLVLGKVAVPLPALLGRPGTGLRPRVLGRSRPRPTQAECRFGTDQEAAEWSWGASLCVAASRPAVGGVWCTRYVLRGQCRRGFRHEASVARTVVRRSSRVFGKWCGIEPRTIVLCRPEVRRGRRHLLRRASSQWSARRGIAPSLPVPVGASLRESSPGGVYGHSHQHTSPDLGRSRATFGLRG